MVSSSANSFSKKQDEFLRDGPAAPLGQRDPLVGSGRRRGCGVSQECGVAAGGRPETYGVSLDPSQVDVAWCWGLSTLSHLFPPSRVSQMQTVRLLMDPQVTGSSFSLRFPHDGSGTPGCLSVSETIHSRRASLWGKLGAWSSVSAHPQAENPHALCPSCFPRIPRS